MASYTRTRAVVYIPDELMPLVRKRMTEEHYGSASAYLLGLVLFDLMSRCRHALTAQMVAEQPEIMDKICAEIVANFGDATRQDRSIGPWLAARIREILDAPKP